MTQMDKVIELAREAGCSETFGMDAFKFTKEELQAFYTLARADLEAEIAGWKADQKENLYNQCELQAEINQLRKERQAYKDVTEYQKAEIAKLRQALEIIAAYRAKLLTGVEMPEPTIITDMDWCENEVYDIGDMQQYAAAAAAQERLRIEDAAMAWVQSGGETNLLAAIRGESK